MTTFDDIDTPAALIDRDRLLRNLDRMQQKMNALGVRFRPHVKTSKCAEVVDAQIAAGAQGVTVSTLKEAEAFFETGVSDILYAVSIIPTKFARALALRRRGCALKLIVDNTEAAAALAEFGRAQGEVFEVWIEVDTDDHRSNAPEDDLLIDVGRVLQEGGIRVGGVLTHAGSSYELNDDAALAALAEQERAGCVRAAERLREAGIACAEVSVGSTPTALRARHLDGVTEVRAGVYAFFDLVMHNVGVCPTDEIALSVLTTVIGHQAEKGWAIVDAGWMAMSRDRGTSKQSRDFGYGLPCRVDGTPLAGFEMIGANQEHGIIAAKEGVNEGANITTYLPIGTKLRILPNHACATGAQFPEYHTVLENGDVAVWSRFQGW